MISGKPIVNLPGCPPNPYTLLAVVLEYVTMNKLPELDELRRPIFAYERVIHENCPRRAHFDAGRLCECFRRRRSPAKGWCLYKLGCKGPVTHAACSTRHFNETPGVWPIGLGAPVPGMHGEERGLEDGARLRPCRFISRLRQIRIRRFTAGRDKIKTGAAVLVGAIAGAIGSASWVASQRFRSSEEAGVERIAADRDTGRQGSCCRGKKEE